MRTARVIVDAERLRYPESGLGQFCLHLGRALKALRCGRFEPVFHVARGRRDAFGPSASTIPVRRWSRLLPRRKTGGDLWHATHQEPRDEPRRSGLPYVLTLHDLNFLAEKTDRKAGVRLAAVQERVAGAAALTFISEFVREEAERHLHLPDVPRRVVHNGVPDLRGVEPRRPSWLSGEADAVAPFLLFVGIVTAKKNVHTLLPMLERLPRLRLVIAGRRDGPYAAEVEAEVARRGLGDRVLVPGLVSEGEKAFLYRACEALVFPSRLEGFGLPPLEAMLLGRPAIVSRLTSLPEVVGDAGFYFDSFEPDAMAAAVTSALEAFRSEPSLAERAVARARGFTWERAAREYVGVYGNVLGEDLLGEDLLGEDLLP